MSVFEKQQNMSVCKCVWGRVGVVRVSGSNMSRSSGVVLRKDGGVADQRKEPASGLATAVWLVGTMAGQGRMGCNPSGG